MDELLPEGHEPKLQPLEMNTTEQPIKSDEPVGPEDSEAAPQKPGAPPLDPETNAGENVSPGPDVPEPEAPHPAHHGASIDPAPANPLSDELIRKQAASTTRRSMIVLTAGAAAAYSFYRYLDRSPQDEGQPKLLRDTFLTNQAITQGVFHDAVLAPTYPVDKATMLRTNGNYGLKEKIDPAAYRIQVAGLANPKSYGDRYTEDLTAWDYKLADSDAPAPQEESSKVDPAKEKHPEARPGQGTGTNDTKGEGGSSSAPGQPPAKSVQPATSAPPADAKYAAMPPEFQKAFNAMQQQKDAANGGRRDRGQEEAGESDSELDKGTPGILLTMDDIRRLPHQELVTQFKCIEGWSQIVHWGGVRFADFIKAYPPQKNPDGSDPKYVYLETPDGDYYCGYDLIDCMHPQTLLVTEMGGKPLEQFHGAPLRLHMPIKYGYKQLKRIGLIAYTNSKPDDYWTKLGYDWYAGL